MSVVVRAPEVGDPPVVVVPEVSGTAGADGARVVVPLLGSKVSVQLPGDEGAGLPPVSLRQGVLAQVEVFPGAHHLPGHGIQVVPLVLGPVVEAVAGLERGTL